MPRHGESVRVDDEGARGVVRVYIWDSVRRHDHAANVNQLVRGQAALIAGHDDLFPNGLGDIRREAREVTPRVCVSAGFGKPTGHFCLCMLGIFATAVLDEIIVAKVPKFVAGDFTVNVPAGLEIVVVDIHRQHSESGQIRVASLHNTTSKFRRDPTLHGHHMRARPPGAHRSNSGSYLSLEQVAAVQLGPHDEFEEHRNGHVLRF